MTTEKLTEVLQFYFDKITDRDKPYCGVFCGYEYMVDPIQLPSYMYSRVDLSRLHVACHLAWMCEQCLKVFIPEGPEQDIGKANRWLGYVQGELRAEGVYSITDLREHSRS